MSNADRQKEYRARKRNAQRNESVTRVTVTDERNAPVTRSQAVTEIADPPSVETVPASPDAAGPVDPRLDKIYKDSAKAVGLTFTDLTRETNAPVTDERNAPSNDTEACRDLGYHGPLDIYSESRWAYLQSRGHVWDPDKQRGVRPDGVVGVPVPGDPAYGPTGNNTCSCGKDTDHKLVVKCGPCCWGKVG